MAHGALILVTGATGTQGQATVRALKAYPCRIRGLVRSSTSPAAETIRGLGAELAIGDFDDITSLEAAVQGVDAVFLNVSPSFEDPEAETRHAKNMVSVLTQPGSIVKTLVHTTTVLTGQHATFPGWDIWNDFARQYWLSKAANEDLVRASAIPNWTILRPATFMSNYLQPLAPFFFPELLTKGIFRTALKPDTPTMLISPEDVGRFAAAALVRPEEFRHREIDLGSEALTPPQIAAALAHAVGKPVRAEYMPDEEIRRLIPQSHVIAAQTYFNERSAMIDTDILRGRWGIKSRTFEEFLNAHQEDVDESYKALKEPGST